jgi:hypothetical protein
LSRAVKTRFELRLSGLTAAPGEASEAAPGAGEKRLAEHLAAGLRRRGWPVDEIAAAAWGWRVSIENTAFPLWIGCGRSRERSDGFVVFIDPSAPSVRRFFHRIDTTEIVGRLGDSIEGLLTDLPDVHELTAGPGTPPGPWIR